MKVKPRFVFFYAGLMLFLVLLSCQSVKSLQPATDSDVPAFLFYKKALNYLEKQQYSEALAQLDTAILLKPEFAQFYYARGQILELQDNTPAAIKAYEKALNLKSYYPDTWKRLAKLYMDSAQYEKASQVLKFLTESYPDSLQYEVLLADAYIGANKPLLALERINYFDKQGGKSDETLRVRGMAGYELHDCKQAVEYLRKYVSRNPDNFRAQKYLGMACINTGNLEEGISHLNRALQQNPDDPEIYLFRAKYFIGMDKMDTAADQFRQALEMDSNNVTVLLESSRFYLQRKDTTRAQRLLEDAVFRNKTCWECFKYLGIIADARGNYTRAILFLENYISHIYYRDEVIEKRLEYLKSLQLTQPEQPDSRKK
jgi:tetratricopeptide (TPR) repeat protein